MKRFSITIFLVITSLLAISNPIRWNVGYISPGDTIQLLYTNSTDTSIRIIGFDLDESMLSMNNYPDAIKPYFEGFFEITVNTDIKNGYFKSDLTVYTQNDDLVFHFSGIVGTENHDQVHKSMPSPAVTYCQALGYELRTLKDATGNESTICILPDGEKVEVWDFFKGKSGHRFSYCAKNGMQTISRKINKNGYQSSCTACLLTADVPADSKQSTTDTINMSELMIQNKDYELFFPQMGKVNATKVVQKTDIKADEIIAKADLPDAFDWRDQSGSSYVGPVRNQGGCGACYAFSALASAETAFNMDNGLTDNDCIDFSESYLIWCLSRIGTYGDHFFGCDGANYEYMEMEALTTDGVCIEADFPYAEQDPCGGTCTECDQEIVYTFDEWGRIACSDYEAIKQAIYKYGVLNAAVFVAGGFNGYDSGVFYDTQNGCAGDCEYVSSNHGIALVGWGHDSSNGGLYWILRNSWGSNWGEDGYMRINADAARVSCAATYIDYKAIVVENQTATSVTTNSAQLSAIIDTIDEAGNGWFSYGFTENNLDQNSANVAFSQGSHVSFTANISELTSQTTYFFQPFIQTANYTSNGNILNFTTGGSAIAPELQEITYINENLSAEINYLVNPHGAQSTVNLWLSTDGTNFSIVETASISSSTAYQSEQFTLENLSGATTYYFYLEASNDEGTNTSFIYNFTTNQVYTIQFASHENGISMPSTSTSVVQGDSLRVLGFANTGYVVYEWQIETGNGTFTNPKADDTYFKPTSDATLKLHTKDYSLFETFDAPVFPPTGWTQQQIEENESWTQKMGTSKGEPDEAIHEEYNASMSVTSFNNHITKLITPAIDLRQRENNKLCFWYVSREWTPDVDGLKVYFRESSSSEWIEITEARKEDEVYDWTFFEYNLPTSSQETQIAFEANCHYGYGVGLDKVFIYGDFRCIPPELDTDVTAQNIGTHHATLQGTIINDNQCTVSKRGFIWSVTSGFNPLTQGTEIFNNGSFETGSYNKTCSNLPSGTPIYFYAFAENSGGKAFSHEGEFLTLCDAPMALVPSQANAEMAILQWNASFGANNYLIDVSTDPNFNSYFNNIHNYQVNDTIFSITGLTLNEDYYFRLRAHNATGNSEYSNTIEFAALCVPPSISHDTIYLYLNTNGTAHISETIVEHLINAPCGIANITITPNAYSCEDIGYQSTLITIEDLGENIISENITVKVSDTLAPVITANEIDLYLQESNIELQASDIIASITDNCGILDTSIEQLVFNCQNVGTNLIDISSIDINGNRSETTATIHVHDTVKPVAITQTVELYLNESGFANLTANMIDNGSYDNCAIAQMQINQSYFDCDNLGKNQVKFTISDMGNNSTSTWVEMMVYDTIKPEAIAINSVIYLDEYGNGTLRKEAASFGSSDNCGLASITTSIENVTCSDLGIQKYLLTVTDYAGNTDTTTALINIIDTIKPTIANETLFIYIDELGNAELSQLEMESLCSDNCQLNQVWTENTEFSCDAVGDNWITLFANDYSENTTSKQIKLVVKDTLSPVILNITPSIVSYLDENGKTSISNENLTYHVEDNCQIFAVNITPNTFDCVSPSNNLILVSFTDPSGNKTSTEINLEIKDTIRPIIPDVSEVIYMNENGIANLDIHRLEQLIVDNCEIDNITIPTNQFDCQNLGENDILIEANDKVGNSSSNSWIIEVRDTIRPVVNVKPAKIEVDETGTAHLSYSQIDNGSSDNCGISEQTVSIKEFDCSSVGINAVAMLVSDYAGNQSIANTTVEVVDLLPPTILVTSRAIYLNETGEATLSFDHINSGTSDNCAIDSIQLSKTYFTCDDIGAQVIEVVAQDIYGNESSLWVEIEVLDTISPQLSTNDIAIHLDKNSGTSTLPTNYLVIEHSDNCSHFNEPTLLQSDYNTSQLGTNTNICTISDASGNTTSTPFQVYVTWSAKYFTNFVVENQDSSVIDMENSMVKVYVPQGQAKANLRPNFTLSAGAISDFISGEQINLVNPVEKLITAHDGSQIYWKIEVINSPGIDEIPIVVYPNPVSNMLHIELPADNCNVKLHDTKGSTIMEAESKNKYLQLNMSPLLAGTYILKVFDKDGQYISERKLIKK